MTHAIMIVVTTMVKLFTIGVASIWLAILTPTRWQAVMSYTRLPDAMDLPTTMQPSALLMLIVSVIVPVWSFSVFGIGLSIALSCCWKCLDKLRDSSSVRAITLAFLGIFDLLQAAGLIVAIAVQGKYLARTSAGCNSLHGNDAVRDMLLREADARMRANAKSKHPSTTPVTAADVCKDYVTVTSLATYIVTILLITATLAITNPRWKTLKYVLVTAWMPVAAVGISIYAVLVTLKRIIPSVIYLFRLFKQWRLHASLKPKTASDIQHPHVNMIEFGKKLTMPKSKFEQVLSKETIKRSFIENSHYTDLATLTRTSYHLRDILLISAAQPSSDSTTTIRIQTLKGNTCIRGEKSQCWSCTTPICPGCSHVVTPGVPTTAHHLIYCEPHCARCYFKRLCKSRLRSKVCSHGASLIKNEAKTVCSECCKLPMADLRRKRELMEEEEIAHLSRGYLKCSECERRLRRDGGPVWWVCGACTGECRSTCHRSWGSVKP